MKPYNKKRRERVTTDVARGGWTIRLCR